ncbi:MAG: 50S ribosomal protein L3 [bacterium]
MKQLILGKKIGMTQIYNENGDVTPSTVLSVHNVSINSLILKEDRGYNALLLSAVNQTEKKVSKPVAGQFQKLKSPLKKYLFELRVDNISEYSEIKEFNCSSFSSNDSVTLTAKSKGKGHQGTIKKYNFKRGPSSHGSKNHRLPGSIGAGTSPSRVFKGTKMSGKMGNATVTVKSIVLKIDKDNNLIFLKGSVPGPNGANIWVQKNG